MALLFMDGFDSYTAATTPAGSSNTELTTRGYLQSIGTNGIGSMVIGATSGRFGAKGLQALGNGASSSYWARVAAPVTITSSSSVAVGVSFKMDNLPISSGRIFLIAAPNAGSTSSSIVGGLVGVDLNGHLLLCAPDTGSVLATATNAALAPGAWHHVEVVTSFSTSTGTVSKLYLDGLLCLTYTGATIGASANVPNSIGVCAGVSNSSTTNGVFSNTFDDLVISDTSGSSMTTQPNGPTRISTLSPTSDSAVSWTPSSGTAHYSLVNAGWSNTTSYVSDTGSGNNDLYRVGPVLPYTPSTIFAAQVVSMAQTPSGTRTVKNLLSTSAVVASAANTLAVGAYSGYASIFYTDSTGAALTVATVNAMKIGVGD